MAQDSIISPLPVKDINTSYNFNLLTKELNQLKNYVGKDQQSVGTGYGEGTYRIIEGVDKNKYFEIKTRDGWFTTFSGAFQPHKDNGSLDLIVKNFTVDNLFAKTFTVNQTDAMNGDTIMSSYGIIDTVRGNVIYFKDQSGLGVCSFAVDDKCEIRVVNASTGLDIKLVQFTINTVSGVKVEVTYTGVGRPSSGDIVVRKGNSSDATRRNSIYFKTTTIGTPYIDLYTGTTGFTFGNPVVSLGDLTHIVDSDFNSVAPYHLAGSGLYAQNVFLKGKLKISSNADIIGLTPMLATYTSGTTFPASPVNGDWHFKTDTSGGSLKNTWYQYNGATWVNIGLLGTYIDGTGLYTGTIVADKILAGTLNVALTMTSGSLKVGNPSGANIRLDGSGNSIGFYNVNTSYGSLTANSTTYYNSAYFNGHLQADNFNVGDPNNSAYGVILDISGLTIQRGNSGSGTGHVDVATYHKDGINVYNSTGSQTRFYVDNSGNVKISASAVGVYLSASNIATTDKTLSFPNETGTLATELLVKQSIDDNAAGGISSVRHVYDGTNSFTLTFSYGRLIGCTGTSTILVGLSITVYHIWDDSETSFVDLVFTNGKLDVGSISYELDNGLGSYPTYNWISGLLH